MRILLSCYCLDGNKTATTPETSLFGLAGLLNTTAAVDALVRSLPIPLLLREISEDLSLMSRLLSPQNATATDPETRERSDLLLELQNSSSSSSSNSNRSNSGEKAGSLKSAGLEQLHLTSRLRAASDELRRFSLPGLPSVGDILDSSANLTQATLNQTLERLGQPLWRQLRPIKGDDETNTTSSPVIVDENDEYEYYYDEDEEGKTVLFTLMKYCSLKR
jgi:hypothetical protein